jgi:hypothetical protein
MKLRHAALVAACALLTSAPIAAQFVFTSVTGTETLLPPGSPFPPVEGVVNCHGAAVPTGNFYYPCGVGTAGSIRGRVLYALETTSYPGLHGLARIVANINFDRDGQGVMWGSFDLAVPEGGAFEGTYTGHVDVTNVTLRLKIVGHGTGGAVDGLQIMHEDVHDASPFGALQGRVLAPGSVH